MPVFFLDHLALSVRDVAVAAAFYREVLQLEEIKNTASNSATRWMNLGEGRQLHLIPRPEAEIKTNKAVHFALTTADLSAVVARLDALHVAYTDWLDTPDRSYVRQDGIQQVYFQDPDGYWIEVNDAGSRK